MSWLTVEGAGALLFGEKGADLIEALKALVDKDGATVEEIDTLLEQIKANAPAGSDLAEQLDQAIAAFGPDTEWRKALAWLRTPVEEMAKKPISERKKDWKLGSADPSYTAPVPIGGAKLGFTASARASLEIAPADAEKALPYRAVAGIEGALGASAKLEPASLPDVIKKVSFSAEYSAKRALRFSAAAGPKEKTAEAVRRVFKASAQSPLDLAQVQAALARPADQNPLLAITDASPRSRKVDGALGLDLPFRTGAIILSGGVTIDVSLKLRAASDHSTRVFKAAAGDHLVAVEFSDSESKDKTTAMSFGLKAEIAPPDLFKKLVEGAKTVEAKSKEYLKKFAEISDIRADLKSAVTEQINGLDIPQTAKDLLLGEAPNGNLVSDFLIGKIEDKSRPWLAEADKGLQGQLRALLDELGVADLPVEGGTLADQLSGKLGEVLKTVKDAHDKALKDLAEQIDGELGDEALKAQQALNELGMTLTNPPGLDQAEELLNKVKAKFESLVDRVTELRKKIEAAAELTIAANFSASDRTYEDEKRALSLVLDPKEKQARDFYRDFMLAPRSAATALVAAKKKPKGVDLASFSSTQRLREASSRAFDFNLFGWTGSGNALTSADVVIRRIGNQIMLMGAAEAEAGRKATGGESQSVRLAYLYDREAEDAKTIAESAPEPESWVDGAVTVGDDAAAPLFFTIQQKDEKSFTPSDLGGLVEHLEGAGLISSKGADAINAYGADLIAADLARTDDQGDGKLHATFETNLKLNNAQIELVGSMMGGAEVKEVVTRAFWSAMGADQKNAIASVLYDRKAANPNRDDTFGEIREIFVEYLLEDPVGIHRQRYESARRGVRGAAERAALSESYGLVVQAAESAEAFAQLVHAFGFIADTATNSAALRAQKILSLQGVLKVWARPTVDNFPLKNVWDGPESIAVLPLAFLKGMRALCVRAGAEPPDILVSLEDDAREGSLKIFADSAAALP